MTLARRSYCMIRRRVGIGIGLGLLGGMATAQTVTIPWQVSFKGSVEIHGSIPDERCVGMYTVPPGLKLRVTTYLLDSRGSPVPIPYQYICSGTTLCDTTRSEFMTAPAGSTLAVTLTSGIMFNSGETVYACNTGGENRLTSWTFYGFLYK